MSYFSELQGYMNNLQEGQNHEQDINEEAANKKTQTIEDKFNAVTQAAEGWGGAIAQGGILWKHGRKVIQKIADAKSKIDAEQQAASADHAANQETPLDPQGNTQTAQEYAARQLSDQQTADAIKAQYAPKGKAPARSEEEGGGEPAATEAGEGGGGGGGAAATEETTATQSAIRVANQTQLDPASRTQFAPSKSEFTTTQESTGTEFGEATETNIAQSSMRSVTTIGGRLLGKGGGSGSAANGELANGTLAENAAGGIEQSAESGGGALGNFMSGVNKLVQGTKTAASQLSGAAAGDVGDVTTTLVGSGSGGSGGALGGALGAIGGADAIPIIGGIIGIGTMIGGLIHEIHKNHEEAMEQRASEDGGTSARTGIDTNTTLAGGGGSAVGSYIA